VLIARSGFPFTPVIGWTSSATATTTTTARSSTAGWPIATACASRRSSISILSLVKALPFAEHRKIDLMIQVFNATRASNKNFANDSISVYGTPAAPVATAGQAPFRPFDRPFRRPAAIAVGDSDDILGAAGGRSAFGVASALGACTGDGDRRFQA
jgi:hypothetical protein